MNGEPSHQQASSDSCQGGILFISSCVGVKLPESLSNEERKYSNKILGYGGDGDGYAEGRKYEVTREGVGEHAVQEEAYSRTGWWQNSASTESTVMCNWNHWSRLDTGPRSCH